MLILVQVIYSTFGAPTIGISCKSIAYRKNELRNFSNYLIFNSWVFSALNLHQKTHAAIFLILSFPETSTFMANPQSCILK